VRSQVRLGVLFVACAGAAGGAGCDLTSPPSAPRATPAPVTLLVEPEAGPSAVLDLLVSARVSLWVEMYLLTSEDAIAALDGRARAGCDVRVTLEPAPFQSEGANQEAYDRLAAAGARVRWATARFSYTHAKSFSVDHARLVVMTLNLTGSGLGGNREYAVVDDDRADVAAAETIFDADQAGAEAGAAARVVSSPDASRPTLAGLIDGAAQTLALETEELTDPAIVSALVAARGRGVAVTLVWPGPAVGAGSAFLTLAAAGASVRALDGPSIHAKAVSTDGRVAYVGSANLTPTSLDRNRELGLLLADAPLAAALAATIAADAARGAAPSP
jgi:phosphatidylserine/phosphatidylglycerophosphate/cardiolipin synthase-like enzyme